MRFYLLVSITLLTIFNAMAQPFENATEINNYTNYLQPIIVAFIAAVSGLMGYLIQRNNELKLRITEKKRDAYIEFLKDFTETVVAIMHDKKINEVQADRQRILARNQLLLYASDDVIKAYDDWVRYTDENPEKRGDDTEDELFGKVLLKIREDILGGKTKLTVEEISNLNPFHRG